MLIGVMSDSHDNMTNVIKAMNIFKEKGVKYIIHLGDIISPFIARKMADLGWKELTVEAVYGNNDGDKILLRKIFEKVGWSIDNGPRMIDVGNRRILIMHGYNGIDFTKRIAYSLAKNMNGIDAVFYGHTHKKDIKKINGRLVLNPGEVYGGLFGKPSIAIVDLDTLSAEFISF